MTAEGYFGRLEMRISAELAEMKEAELRKLWCDEIVPEKFAVV